MMSRCQWGIQDGRSCSLPSDRMTCRSSVVPASRLTLELTIVLCMPLSLTLMVICRSQRSGRINGGWILTRGLILGSNTYLQKIAAHKQGFSSLITFSWPLDSFNNGLGPNLWKIWYKHHLCFRGNVSIKYLQGKGFYFKSQKRSEASTGSYSSWVLVTSKDKTWDGMTPHPT